MDRSGRSSENVRYVAHPLRRAGVVILGMLLLWRERHRQRRELMMLLYDIDLRDTGLSRDLIAHEGLKWPWQKWHPQLHAFETAARVRVGLYPTAVTAKR